MWNIVLNKGKSKVRKIFNNDDDLDKGRFRVFLKRKVLALGSKICAH